MWHGRPTGCGLWLPEDKKANVGWKGKLMRLMPAAAFLRSWRDWQWNDNQISMTVTLLKLCKRLQTFMINEFDFVLS